MTATSLHDLLTQLQDQLHNLFSKIEVALPTFAPVIDKVEQYFDEVDGARSRHRTAIG